MNIPEENRNADFDNQTQEISREDNSSKNTSETKRISTISQLEEAMRKSVPLER